MVKYTVRLPTGNEYGPADLATLRSWRAEGRIGPDSWVWTEGAPDWMRLDDVLEAGTKPPKVKGAAAARPVAPGTAAKAPQPTRPAPAAGRAPAATPGSVSGAPPGAKPGAGAARPVPGARPAAPGRATASPAPATAGAAKPAAPRGNAGAPGAAPGGTARPRPAAKPGGAGAGQGRPGGAPGPRPRSQGRTPKGGAGSLPWLLLAGAGLVALLAIGAAARLLILPRLESWRATSRLRGEALPAGRFADPEAGLLLEAPGDWVMLRPDSSLLVAPSARARLAHATLGGRATLTVLRQPPGLAPLDVILDEVVRERRALVSGYAESGRSDAVLAGRPARRLTASWSEAGVEQKATAIATRDAWLYVALLAWGPAAGGAELESAFESLAAALDVAGALEQRIIGQATELLAHFPELSRPSVELLLRFGGGGEMDPAALGAAVVTAVDRGLGALGPDQIRELRQIYAQVFDPLSDADRQRLAAWQQAVREGRPLDRAEALAARRAVRASLGALPGETLVELQALNEKAIFAGAPRS